MLPKTLTKGFDARRLRSLLAVFFLALAVPTAVLIWQAYGQLKWEAFHQHRVSAEELTVRIDARLNELIRTADTRSFAEYTFLVVSGDPDAKFVQHSPLSRYPVVKDLPGLMGYFQVDTEGTFSTPLLPPAGTEAASLGISESEYAERLKLAEQIQTVLADNRLVQSRQEIGVRRGIDAIVAAPSARPDEEDEVLEEKAYAASRDRQVAENEELMAGLESEPAEPASEVYSQQVFDQLNQPRRDAGLASGSVASAMDLDDDVTEVAATEARLNRIGKVSDLNLDASLQKKSEEVEGESAKEQSGADGFTLVQGRTKRRETTALPETITVTGSKVVANVDGPTDLRISTFESEVDPLEFSLLDSGHFVLFRKVWRDGERYIQGMLVEQNTFVRDIIAAEFSETALSDMSNLIVAYQDDVISTFSGRQNSSVYPDFAENLDGALLFRNKLSAPLNSLELIYSITRLPPGAGAGVLGWVTLILAIVFVAGFAALYRLGMSQINLARQQQDFVSAVSHELKTPLTSIRMYGEMLKEGWADEEKRQTYYEYIHDESERLSRLISNVLELAKITRNEPRFDLKPTSVGELMSNIESKISTQVERAGFELRLERTDDADKATIDVDEDCFAQIIINLVDNGIKFSKNAEQKVIEIGSRLTAGNKIIISVRDYGPGIPKDQMQKIFQLFYRTESELTRETVGTGIGLAIVHQLTLAMNASVDVVNVEPGAEFKLSFSLHA